MVCTSTEMICTPCSQQKVYSSRTEASSTTAVSNSKPPTSIEEEEKENEEGEEKERCEKEKEERERRKGERGKEEEGRDAEEEERKQVKKDVTGWTVVTRNKRQKKMVQRRFESTHGGSWSVLLTKKSPRRVITCSRG